MPLRDRELYLAYLRAYRLKRGMKPRVPRVSPICAGCGKVLGPRGVKYCSLRCQHEAQFRGYISRWISGEISGGSVASVSDTVRRYLMQVGGEQCSACGWNKRNPVTGKVPLDIDHINGNYADHSPGNLCLLCPNCHALTPTYKALNRGNGRPYAIVRREQSNK